jgi:DNA-binding MarR family transcriptional regulator
MERATLIPTVSTSPPAVEHRPPASLPRELLENSCFLLARIGFAVKARAIDELERAGFSLYQYSVLATLGEAARETQGAIADMLGLDRGQLVGILDDLEERGLVERRRDPSDRRRHTVSLTPAGKKELARLRAIVKQIEESVLAPLDAKTRKALQDALLQVLASLRPE